MNETIIEQSVLHRPHMTDVFSFY